MMRPFNRGARHRDSAVAAIVGGAAALLSNRLVPRVIAPEGWGQDGLMVLQAVLTGSMILLAMVLWERVRQ